MILEFIDLNIIEICTAILITLLAHSIKGLSDFGCGLIAIPLLAFFSTYYFYCTCPRVT